MTSGKGFSKRTCCIVISVILIAGILAVGLGLGIPALIAKEKQKKEAELNKEINRSLSTLLNNMDPKENPCDYFYYYACGGFMDNAKDNVLKVDTDYVIKKQITNNISALITSSKSEDEPVYCQKMKRFFESCMNIDILEKLGKGPLTELLDDFGGWPILLGSTWNSSQLSGDWLNLLSKIRNKHIFPDYLIEIAATPDPFDESSYILMVNHPSKLGLPLASYSDSKTLNAYKEYLKNTVEFLGGNKTTSEREVNEILQFEMDIVNLAGKISTEKQPYSKLSIDNMTSLISGIDWHTYFQISMPYEMNSTQIILVRGISYFQGLSSLLMKTDFRILTNYILWRIITPSGVRYLNKEAVNLQTELYKSLGLQASPVPTRLETCVDDTMHFMNMAVSALYIKKFVPPSLKEAVKDLVNTIKTQFGEVLNTLSWMDVKTKEIALKKIENVKYWIAYPDEMLDDEKINNFYKQLEISSETLFQNVLNVKWFIKIQNLRLLKDSKELEWAISTDALESTAAYSIKNILRLNIPNLQGIYYNLNGLASTNFGALGAVIGHEFFHAIDRKGGNYDEKGVFNPWWSNFTFEKFSTMENCFIRKYSDFTLPDTEMKVHGQLTAAENLADNMGLLVAHKAFLKWMAGHTERLPKNFHLTSKQLFWISYASKFCAKANLTWETFLLYNSIYSPEIFRVIGPVSNMPDFAEDFHCPLKSKMLSYSRCVID